jgi:DNA mismatch endonuclease (patch repair protein)
MVANRGTETAPEIALRSALHRRGLRFRKHLPPIPSLRCNADVVFSTAKIAVFVDGCFWHRCPEHATFPKANAAWWQAKLDQTFQRDRRNDAVLDEAGWTVVRVWEHEDPGAAAARVEKLVRHGSRA